MHQLPMGVPRTSNRLTYGLGRLVLRLLGWRIEGQFPKQSKFIAAVAFHTSNWDFVIAVAAMFALQLKVKFLGKDALFFWPFSLFLRAIGGIAVDRSSAHGVVGQMVEHFDRADSLVLALAPEGTRKKVPEWKAGFLHIAHQANVPVVPVGLDFNSKSVIIFPSTMINEDIPTELQRVKQMFRQVCAKNPQLA